MHIALCTPVSIDLFDNLVEHHAPLIKGYTYPFAFFLASRLLERQHIVTVVTTAFDAQQKMEWWSSDKRLHVIAVPRRRPRFTCLDAYRREVRAMRHELRRCRPDIVHAQWTYEFADAGLSSGFPCLVTARDAPWIVARQFRAIYRLYRAIYESLWVTPRISYMTSVSAHIDSVFQKEPFLRPAKTWVVPNGIDEQFVAKKPKPCVANPLAPVFFDLSTWNDLKNPIPLLQAFQRVRSVLPMARLCVIGLLTGGRTPQERYAIRNNLLEGVELLGSMSNLELLHFLEDQVDIVVHTTKEESFSMISLESMAKGIPVIGGKKSGAVPFVLGGGKAGILVNIQSPLEIAEAMLRLVNDTTLYEQTATQALARVRECFLLDKVVTDYEQIYYEMLKNER